MSAGATATATAPISAVQTATRCHGWIGPVPPEVHTAIDARHESLLAAWGFRFCFWAVAFFAGRFGICREAVLPRGLRRGLGAEREERVTRTTVSADRAPGPSRQAGPVVKYGPIRRPPDDGRAHCADVNCHTTVATPPRGLPFTRPVG